jgi:serine/threonine-protein kinase RsbW
MPAMVELKLELKQLPEGLVVRVLGDASVVTVEKLHRELGALSLAPPRLVILDLSALDFVASLGMGAILAFDKRVAHEGGYVRLAALQPNVHEAFRHARLLQAFEVFVTVEAALHEPVHPRPPRSPAAVGKTTSVR